MGAATAAVACLGLTGANPAEAQQGADQRERTVHVRLHGLQIGMPDQLPAGPVRFRIMNAGEHVHGFEIEGQGIERAVQRLQPGRSATLQVNLQRGEYYVYCPVRDHEERGMHKTVQVLSPGELSGTESLSQQGQQGQQGRRGQGGLQDEGWELEYGALYTFDPEAQRWEPELGYVEGPEQGFVFYSDDLLDQDWQQGQQGQQQQGQQQQQQGQQRRAHQDRVVRGEIADLRHFELEGHPEKHTLVKIRFQDGRTQIVDLGPRDDLSDLDLTKGDRITVRAHEGRVLGHDVLIGDRLAVDGESLRIRHHRGPGDHEPEADRRSGPQQRRTSPSGQRYRYETAPGQARQPRTVRGTVDAYSFVTGADDQQRSLLLLTLDDGKTIEMLLPADAEPLRIGSGDEVLLRGDRLIVNGRTAARPLRVRLHSGEDQRAGGLIERK